MTVFGYILCRCLPCCCLSWCSPRACCARAAVSRSSPRRPSHWRLGRTRRSFLSPKQLLFERLDVPNAANLRLLMSTDANFSYPDVRAVARAESGARRSVRVPRDGGECDCRRKRGARARARSLGELLRRSRRTAATRPRDSSGRRHRRQRTRGRDQRRVLGTRIRPVAGSARTVDQTQRCSGHDRRRESTKALLAQRARCPRKRRR